ncbi:homoserine kinase [Actinocrinis puniceicyclus]|uniref:Homoserine kinase n=1 Tax=Actinocrinis puniceicyclus TaxID=977794 RepID=A0A8J7WT51_9ACTN|nr:homoserine kinase [Actinocrinis puniceicyclus]
MRPGPVTVRPPATSANLGPGFDAFGLALELRDEVVVEALPEPGLTVEVFGEGAGDVPLDERHLLVRALRAGFDALGGQPAGLRVTCRNRIPHGRGLGSSSAAICAGLTAARDLADGGALVLDDDALLDLANRIEGHPDNVAPALRGGLTIAWTQQDPDGPRRAGAPQKPDPAGHTVRQPEHMRAFALRLDPVPQVAAVAFVPPNRLATEVARGLLPDMVPHRDAAFNAGRAALLTAALTAPGLSAHHRAELLHAGTRDRLHQGYRAAAMPDSAALIRRLRAEGFAAFVSGAGPTVLALTVGPEWEQKAVGYAPPDWDVMVLTVAGAGTAGGAGPVSGAVRADTP